MKKTELLTAIKSVMLGVEKSASVMSTDFLIFDGDWIRSFKDEISVSFPLKTGIQAAIKAEEMFKIVSKMGKEEIEISQENDKVVIKDSNTTLKMNTLQPEQHKHFLDRVRSISLMDLDWFYLPKDFKEGLDFCLVSASTGISLEMMAGIHFENNMILSTDNKRVSAYYMEESVSSPFTLPTKSAEGLSKLGVDLETVALSKAWVHFSNKGGATFSTRLMSGVYPTDDVLTLFKRLEFDKNIKSFTLPNGIGAALDRARILSSTDEASGWSELPQVSLSYSKGFLEIKAGRDIGEIVDRVEWKENALDEGVELKMSPDFLKKIIGITREFKLSPTKKATLFSSKKFQHIMVAWMSK